MNQITLDPSLSIDQPENVPIVDAVLTTSEPEIMVLDPSLLALIGGGDGITWW
jgi:hypothetical protein